MTDTMELSLSPGAGGSVTSFADLDAYLGAVADAGFPCVSLGLQQVAYALAEPGGLDRVVELLRTHGLQCRDVLSVVVRRDAEESLAAADDVARLAGAVGAEWVLALLFTRVRDESVDTLGRVADAVGAEGARLAFELTPRSPVSTIGEALALVDRVGSARMGVMIDTWHFSHGGSTWEELETIPLDRLAFVQFDDALPMRTDDVMEETTNRRAWPGEGELDLERFSRTLVTRGWRGLVSVEVLSEELRRLDVRTFARRAYESSAPYWA